MSDEPPGDSNETVGATLEAGQAGAPIHEVVAPRIGRFAVLRKIGEGAMGKVFAGYDEQLDRKVAIKLLHRTSRLAHLRLAREAQGLARLSHPNVVQVYEIGEHDRSAFIAMEFVDGVTLTDWSAAAPRTWSATLPVLLAAGRGLAAAHDKGLIHRDFKPDNVMVDTDGRVRVMDFGLVRGAKDDVELSASELELEADAPSEAPIAPDLQETADPRDIASSPTRSTGSLRDRLTQTGSLMGTPAYMSPEQFTGMGTDARSDQFSFCVTAWELLYAQRPFAGKTVSELCLAVTGGELREPPRDAVVPGWIRKVLERGMASDPALRWPSMAELLAALADDPRRRRAIVGTGLVVLALLAGAFGLRHWLDEAARAQAEQTCSDEGRSIATLWSDEIADEIGAAFAASHHAFAPDSWQRTRTQLDAYAEDWASARTGSCRETRLDHTREPDSLTRVEACLDDARASFAATIEVLRSPDARLIAHAAQLPVTLPRVSACVDEASLALRPVVPEGVELDALEAKLERASALEIVGDYAGSLTLASEVTAAAATLGWPPFEARALGLVGDLQRDLGDTEAARAAYERAFSLAGEAGADETLMRTAIKLALLIGHDLARFDEGRAWGQVAAMLVRRLGAEQHLDAANLQVVMGRIETGAANYPEARERLQRAQQLYEAALGPSHPEVSVTLEALATIEQTMGEGDRALALLERALAIREAAYGPNHPEVAALLVAIGSVHDDRGEYQRARALMDRALAIRELAFGPDHPEVAESLLYLGIVDCNVLDFQAGLERFERALAIREAASIPNRKRIADLLLNIGLAHAHMGHPDEALAANERALALYEAMLGASHPRLAHILVNIAAQRRIRGRFDEAEAALARAMRIYELNFGLEHTTIATVHQSIGTLQEARGDLEGALASYSRAVELLERIHGADHFELSFPLFELANLHVRRGELEQARRVYERVLAIELRAAAGGHVTTGTRRKLADVLWQLGQPAAAREQIATARTQLDATRDAALLAELDAWDAAHRQ